MSHETLERPKSRTSRTFFNNFFKLTTMWNIKVPRYWPFVRGGIICAMPPKDWQKSTSWLNILRIMTNELLRRTSIFIQINGYRLVYIHEILCIIVVHTGEGNSRGERDLLKIWHISHNSVRPCQYKLDVTSFSLRGIDVPFVPTLIARFMGPTWGPSGSDRTQVGPMLAPWILLSEQSRTILGNGI